MSNKLYNLIIDTTTDKLLIILFNDSFKDIYIGADKSRRHAASLLEIINNLFQKYDISKDDHFVIGVVVGPGSFTGIRVGVASANALAKAFSSKVIELNALDIILGDIDRGISLIPCKNSNYYALIRYNDLNTYSFTNDNELKELKKEYSIYYYSDNYIDNAIKIFNNKFLYGKTSKYAIPFYIRETSAERKMDQCEKTSSEISTERINATNISQQANLNHKNSEETPKLQEEHINYEILFANASNLNEIFDIENSCFDAPWSIRLIKEEIEVLNGQTILLKNKKSGEIIGYACYRIVDNDSELMRIAIKKNFRDKGLGHLLLDEVIRLVKIKGAKKLNLEVASINAPAVKLYEKHLFKKDGVRKNYYGLGIDGLLFSRCLDKE